MRKLMLTICVVIILSMFLGLTGLSQNTRSQAVVKIRTEEGIISLYEGSYALVIGASRYTKGWSTLNGVNVDVEKVSAVLKEHGFHVETLINPTKDRLDQTIRSFIGRYGIKAGNRLLVYYAGHGYTEKNNGVELGYIVPVDAPLPNKDLEGFIGKAISMNEIENYAFQIRSKHALFIFDSCFSGTLFEPTRRAVPPVISSKTAKPVRQFITSGTDEQEVPDNSIFCQQFVEALRGEADLNGDNFVTGDELGSFLEDKVTNYSKRSQTPRHGKIRNANLDKGDFVFALDLSEKLREEERYWTGINKESISQLVKYIDKYPQGKYKSEALALIEKLEKVTNVASANAVKAAFPIPIGTAVAPLMRSYNYETVVLDKNGSIKSRPKGEANYYEDNLGSEVKLEMVYVPRGSYLMGNDDIEAAEFVKEVKKYVSDAEDKAKEVAGWSKPQHRVEVEGFYMGKYEVTQGQWKAIMGNNPSKFTGDENLPVESVSWEEAVDFCKRLSAKTGREYRLPSEGEWEYAARGGTRTAFAYGETINPNIVNYNGAFPYGGAAKGENRGKTVRVGSLPPNAFGLYEMPGNVWEWCEDSWHDSYNNAPKDGAVWEAGADNSRRVLRGGSWASIALNCRSANRNRNAPDGRDDADGFRVVASARTLK